MVEVFLSAKVRPRLREDNETCCMSWPHLGRTDDNQTAESVRGSPEFLARLWNAMNIFRIPSLQPRRPMPLASTFVQPVVLQAEPRLGCCFGNLTESSLWFLGKVGLTMRALHQAWAQRFVCAKAGRRNGSCSSVWLCASHVTRSAIGQGFGWFALADCRLAVIAKTR